MRWQYIEFERVMRGLGWVVARLTSLSVTTALLTQNNARLVLDRVITLIVRKKKQLNHINWRFYLCPLHIFPSIKSQGQSFEKGAFMKYKNQNKNLWFFQSRKTYFYGWRPKRSILKLYAPFQCRYNIASVNILAFKKTLFLFNMLAIFCLSLIACTVFVIAANDDLER